MSFLSHAWRLLCEELWLNHALGCFAQGFRQELGKAAAAPTCESLNRDTVADSDPDSQSLRERQSISVTDTCIHFTESRGCSCISISICI